MSLSAILDAKVVEKKKSLDAILEDIVILANKAKVADGTKVDAATLATLGQINNASIAALVVANELGFARNLDKKDAKLQATTRPVTSTPAPVRPRTTPSRTYNGYNG